MQGASSRDGKLHGNRQTVEAYDADHKRSRHLSQPGRPAERGGHSGGVHEASGHDEIKKVVEEHGPAHEVHIEHDDGGQHHVTSHHEDGYSHGPVTHDSAAMAHAHAAHAAGIHDTQELSDAHEESDHAGAQNAGSFGRAGERHRIERHASDLNFMEGED